MIEKQITIGGKTITVHTRSNETIINDTKYESYIRVVHDEIINGVHTVTGSYGNYVVNEEIATWHNFPVPTTMHRVLHDVDVDAFTDLLGFTHRNRVRHDVEDFEVGFSILNDDDEQNLLNLISPEWIYVELTNKKTKQKSIHKMYASDKEWDVYNVWQDMNGNWCEANQDFAFSLVEE